MLHNVLGVSYKNTRSVYSSETVGYSDERYFIGADRCVKFSIPQRLNLMGKRKHRLGSSLFPTETTCSLWPNIGAVFE